MLAHQLTSLTLEPRSDLATRRSADILQLIASCTALRHLNLARLWLRDGLVAAFRAPIYHLQTLQLTRLQCLIDEQDLAWLIGRSGDSLRSLVLTGSTPILAGGCEAIATLAPRLQEVSVSLALEESGEEVGYLFKMANQASVRRVKITITRDPDKVFVEGSEASKDEVARAVAGLDAHARAKVTYVLEDNWESDFSEDSDGDDSD